MTIMHGDHQCSGYGPGKWFRCGACRRKCCYCFGSDSELRSFVNLCDECWGHATKQAEIDGFDPEGETRAA